MARKKTQQYTTSGVSFGSSHHIGYESAEQTARRKNKRAWIWILALVVICAVFTGRVLLTHRTYSFDLASVPPYDGRPYVELNGNKPLFTDAEKADTSSFERYSRLDLLGRVGVAYANVSKELMPAEDREDISSIRPTGWINKKYPFIDKEFLYNRCHLIAFALAGENANERNLFTGTRYLNVEGMLPFEVRVARYVELTGNHVLYRVTPVFEGDDRVVRGVEMEGWSVEDGGENICFHVFVYNVQPGVAIDYRTGESKED
jgi:DNA-entry nuclease